MSIKGEDPLDDSHFLKVLETFREYSEQSKKRLNVTRNSLQSLPTRHQKLLEQVGYNENLADIEKAIDGNYDLIKLFIGRSYFFKIHTRYNNKTFFQRAMKISSSIELMEQKVKITPKSKRRPKRSSLFTVFLKQ